MPGRFALRVNPIRDDGGVSPVLGMVMVLAVSIIGTVAVLTWGLPAIDEMKANVEVQSVRNQMQELLADIQELVAGTAGKTAKRWQPSLQRGQMAVDTDSEAWIVALDRKYATPDYNFHWGCANGGQNPICLESLGTGLNAATYEVYVLSGTQADPGAVSTTSDCATPGPGTLTSELVVYLCVDNNGPIIDLSEESVRVDILESGDVVAQAWYLRAGDVTFTLNAGVTEKRVVVTNGALFQGTEDQFVLLNTPPIPPPKVVGTVDRFFMRFVDFDGAAQFAGEHRNDVLLSLENTGVRSDLTCEQADDPDDCIKRVRIYPLGTMGPVWRAYFTSASNEYDFTAGTNAIAAAPTDASEFVEHAPTGRAGFTLVHSTIEVSG